MRLNQSSPSPSQCLRLTPALTAAASPTLGDTMPMLRQAARWYDYFCSHWKVFHNSIFQIYHFCHEDGKQDTFQCGYGTIFNEYIGTCDFINSVQCLPGEGYAPKRTPVQHSPYTAHTPNRKPTKYAHSASVFHKKPVPYTKPKRYHEPTTKPIPYNKPATYNKPALNSKPISYHKPGTYSQKTHQSSGPHRATGKTLADPIKPFTHFGKK